MAEIRDLNESFNLRAAQVAAQLASRSHGEGGGGSSGDMGPRVAKLEAMAEAADKRLGRIEDDLRSFMRWGIAAFVGGFVLTWAGLLGLAALMAKGFGWL
jgi:hypothetical protein